jgi:hypothetical protein
MRERVRKGTSEGNRKSILGGKKREEVASGIE